MSEYVTIPVHKKTREMLKSIGRMGETYDDLIRKLVSLAEYSEIMETHYRRLEERDKFIHLEDL